MTFDFCFATYNSSKWLDGCVKALANLDYDKKQVSLYFADNASQDDTVAHLEKLKEKYGSLFGAFEILPQSENKGFGTASNAAARAGHGDYVFFFNVDTEIFPDALTKLEAEIKVSSSEWGAFEIRQFPYEHPKYYFPVTMEVSWASGATFIVRRSVLEEVGGFDETIFMYAEDVELSWRIRLHGYKIKYVPAAITYHYVYKEAGEIKPHQVAGSITANLIVRAKYGTHKDIQEWHELFEEMRPHWAKVPGVPELIDRQLKKIHSNMPMYRKFYKDYVEHSNFTPTFMGFDYEFAREGAFYKNHLPKNGPRISVVVRTYRRPKVLALTLESLRYQTYKNFEVIVVEDGDVPMAKETAENAKKWLDLRYIPAGKSVGQCEAGNIGLRAATGDYLCFLDDDDYFFAEHLEVLACLAEENPDAGLVVAGSIEAKTIYNNEDHTDFTYVVKRNFTQKSIEAFEICTDNLFPIQAPIFKRELFEKYGGLDLRLDGLHDWDLWVRYYCHTKFVTTQKVTSIYKIPADMQQKEKRDAFINYHRKIVYENFKNYQITLTAQDLHRVVWTPEMAEKNMKKQNELKDHEAALRQSALEISQSNSWKVMAPIRILFNMIRMFLNLLQLVVNRCLGFLGRLFYDSAMGWNKLADKVGPQKPNLQKASVEQLHSFVILAKKSLSLKGPAFFKNLLKK